jgi:acyl-CoA synthetase (AMP-forming)/AMP-acid ligase II
VRQGLGYLFDPALAVTPDKVAIIQGETSLSFRELDRRADQLAGTLRRDGVGLGARVALVFDNDYRFLECYFGALRIGAVVVPVNHRLSNDGIFSILENADAEVLLVSASQVSRLAALPTGASSPRRVVELDALGPGMIGYDAWIAGASATPPPRVPISHGDIAIQAYTAGSTGRPKGCLLSHGGQLWNLDQVVSVVGFTSGDRAVVATPFGHKNATMSIKRLLRVGGSVVLLRAFDPEEYLAAVDRFKVTCTTGVPAMYQMLVAQQQLFSRYDTSSVRICFVASAQVPSGLQQAIRTYFPKAHLQEIYGATEAGFLLQALDGTPGLIPIPGAGVRILREDGSECATDNVGEITFQNHGVTLGYYRNPGITAERLRDGRYHTGDLGRRTADGRYVVLGRKDDMIVTGGENVYPKEIEDVLLRHAAISAACVVPVPHRVKGQVPVAFVVLRYPEAATEAAIKQFYFAHGAAYAHPRRVFFLPELPLSAPGKIDRSHLRAMAESAVGEQRQGG